MDLLVSRPSGLLGALASIDSIEGRPRNWFLTFFSFILSPADQVVTQCFTELVISTFALYPVDTC